MNKTALVAHLQIEVEELEAWLAQNWLVSTITDADLEFSETDIARARLIRDLKGDFGVNDPGLDIILHLLDQLHGFRQAFEGLHADLQGRTR